MCDSRGRLARSRLKITLRACYTRGVLTKQIVVVCEDAGAASALAPAVRLLQLRGDTTTWRLGDVARRVFRDHGLDTPDQDVAVHIGGHDVVLLGTTSWGLRVEARAVLEARAARVPSFGVLDFWSNYETRLSFPGSTGLAATPDRIAVIDDAMRSALEALGVPRNRIVVTGSPAFEATLASAGRWAPVERTVLFLSQPLHELNGDLGYDEFLVLEALAGITTRANARLLVRAHPREDRAALAQFLTSLPGEVRLDDTPSLLASTRFARLVVGMTSVALIHTAIFGAPTISAQLHRKREDPLPSNATGLTFAVTSERDLESRVLAALDGDLPLPSRAPDWKGATARVVSALDALCIDRPKAARG